MSDESSAKRIATERKDMLGKIFRDVQFWIPVGVLVGGILLLIAIH